MTGAYTEITEIVTDKDTYNSGDTVWVSVYIKNLHTATIHIYCVAEQDGERFIDLEEWVSAESTFSFGGYFTMPSESVTITAYSYYEADGIPVYDDTKTKDVPLAGEPPPELEGTITRKELEYNESQDDIPASNIPSDKRGLVHVWGRNDTDESQTLGVGWIITDPDGLEVERHEDDWATGWVGSGEDREFIGGRFSFSKVGTYRIAIALYMDSSDPVEVDRYEGDLCSVVPSEPEFSQFEIADYQKV